MSSSGSGSAHEPVLPADEDLDWEPHRTESRAWLPSHRRGPRADRELTSIEVRLPPLIAGLDHRTDRTLEAMSDNALGVLAQLDATHGARLAALNQLLLRTESVASSRIENIDASMADYGRALYGERANASAVSMASATDALVGIIEAAGSTGLLQREALRKAHHALFRRHPEHYETAGSFRTRQNWIGGSDYSPRNALFVPPPPELVEPYLDDLFAFANRDDVPVLTQAAIVHAQFESIHPFTDGNGRIGRTLIHAVLRRRRATRYLTVPIASGLVAHRERYFDALDDYRSGHARTIVAMLAAATLVSSAEARRSATVLHEIGVEWREALGDVRAGSVTEHILGLLPVEPIVTVDHVAARTGHGVAEVREVVEQLRRAKIVVPAGRRGAKIWAAVAILDELSDLNDRIHADSRRKGDSFASLRSRT